ncbi:unnamed protein product [Hydatigera taeniaeformis]|uniref:Xaa-Pro dipeptidase n=1 Tax=Hydatigena taeniaeformis TaxID=6205 RepID=A0A0R3X3Q6_HYDTA|nr:unnamed protein product [Hydatigera taeniaeformis]
MESYYKLGDSGLAVPMELHRVNRLRLCNRLQSLWSSGKAPTKTLKGVYILLEGGSLYYHGESDVEYVFRQESYFHWAFGGQEPFWKGAIEVATQHSILFVPKVSEEEEVFAGEIPSPADIAARYGVDEVHYTNEIKEFFNEKNPTLLLTLLGLNSDSGKFTLPALFDGIEKFNVDSTVLHHEISECRLIKTPLELAVMRYAIAVTSAAHRHLMRKVKPGMFQFQMESLFQHYCYANGGCRHISFPCIAATGRDTYIINYGYPTTPNDSRINEGDMCLFDMGAEYYCYCADITCSFPVNGKFTSDQRFIYEAVLASNRAVIGQLRPGVSWVDMHNLAARTLLEHLKAGGLLRGHIEDMMSVHLAAIFSPCGLGHLLGCDAHDVGGYNKGTPSRPIEPGLNGLRTARYLMPNMVLTVEPGCYFIKKLLDEAKASPKLSQFLVLEELERFNNFGGVRVEDDVLITEDGCEILSDVPRTVEEIEDWMSRETTEYDSLI